MRLAAARFVLGLCDGNHCESGKAWHDHEQHMVDTYAIVLTVLSLAAARFVLGLCDGNHCESGEAGRDRGNGRIVVSLFKEHSPPRNHCHWVPEKVISIPSTAAFLSYAGLATRGNQLLISSKVWHVLLPHA